MDYYLCLCSKTRKWKTLNCFENETITHSFSLFFVVVVIVVLNGMLEI